MSIGSALKFEKFFTKGLVKGVIKDPKRLFLGADPLTTKFWNKALGRNDRPLVNQLGGPTKQTFNDAKADGINTGTASTLHGAAKGVASVLGAYYGGNALYGASGIGGAAGGLDAVGSGAYANGAIAGSGIGGSVAPVAGIGAGAASAIPEVVVSGSAGGGLGSAAGVGAAAGAGAASADSNGFNWKKLVSKGLGQQQQQQPQQNDWLAEMLRQQEEQRKAALLRQQISALLAQQSMQPGTPVATYGPPA